MSETTESRTAVPVSRIFLYLENPRHDPVDAEAKTIARLCDKENVFQLARDIAKHGVNPLENFGLILAGKHQDGDARKTYVVVEGNRRICAIKLLNDPDLAPANLRKSFEKLAESWTQIKSVPAVIFESRGDVDLWLDRIHSGLQGGIGRKEWNSEQKTRFNGENKNRSSQALLDYAERKSMISAAERAGKLTTVQRFVANDVFREMLGLDQSDPDEIGRTRPEGEFDIILRRFIRDLIGKQSVNSRMNKDAIIAYARPLSALNGVSPTRVEAEPLLAKPETDPRKGKPKPPTRPKKATHVLYQNDIAAALKTLGNEKLISLYHSICTVDLDPHTPIIAVGAWSFFETLTACAGRTDNTSFDSYLSKAKLGVYGIPGEVVTYRSAMERIRAYGNTTKHHPISATFNGDQLNNDITTLKDVILSCIKEATVKSGP